MMSHFRCGLVPLSGDPITFGHLDMIRRAKEQCDSLIVLVANNDRKEGQYLFSLFDRRYMVDRAVQNEQIPSVRVIASDGLLGDVFLKEACDVMFRGIRNEEDRRYEEGMVRIYETLWPFMKGCAEYIASPEALRHISSTMVKICVSHGLDVSGFVPLFVKQALEEKMLRQWKIGVTGQIAMGKSWVSRWLAASLKARTGCAAFHLDLDAIIRSIYAEKSPGIARLCEALASDLGSDLIGSDGTFDARKMSQRFFDPCVTPMQRQKLEAKIAPHVRRKIGEALRGKKGLIIFEWALLVEMDLSHLVNNNVVVVDSSCQSQFVAERGMDTERFRRKQELQATNETKAQMLLQAIERDHHGTLVRYTNDVHEKKSDTNADLRQLLTRVKQIFPNLTSS